MDFGLIVDVETTGLDPASDRIIEIGLLEFAVEGDSQPVITRVYGGLEDPGVPLSPEVERLTGIKTEHLAGRKIDWPMVRDFFEKASIVIAHNMEFDRSFLVAHPELAESRARQAHWACSMKHIAWSAKGYRTRALNYLAADHGFVNPFPHRAIFDCATTFRLIAPHLGELVERSYKREVLIRAYGSPFEVKDLLKQREYRWDPEERVWARVVFEDELEAEREFLVAEVYRGGRPLHQETVIRAP